MKCPKCGFNSFEYLDSCRKCGNDLAAFKMSLGIQPVVMPPGVFTSDQGTGGSEAEPQLAIPPEVAAAKASTDDEFEFDTGAVAPAATPAAAEGSTFGEISFDETAGDTTPDWGGSKQGDGFSGQEFGGFDTEPAAASDSSFTDMFGKEEPKEPEKKSADDFFNSPELADLFKDEPSEKK